MTERRRTLAEEFLLKCLDIYSDMFSYIYIKDFAFKSWTFIILSRKEKAGNAEQFSNQIFNAR